MMRAETLTMKKKKKSGFLLSLDPKRARKERERYASDPEYRVRKIEAQLLWNAENAERKRKNDRKWAQKHGAEAARRYRAKKKAQQGKKRGH